MQALITRVKCTNFKKCDNSAKNTLRLQQMNLKKKSKKILVDEAE